MEIKKTERQQPVNFKSEMTTNIQLMLKTIKKGECVEVVVDSEDLISEQRKISVTAHNFGKKTNQKFTVRILNSKTVGIWLIS